MMGEFRAKKSSLDTCMVMYSVICVYILNPLGSHDGIEGNGGNRIEAQQPSQLPVIHEIRYIYIVLFYSHSLCSGDSLTLTLTLTLNPNPNPKP